MSSTKTLVLLTVFSLYKNQLCQSYSAIYQHSKKSVLSDDRLQWEIDTKDIKNPEIDDKQCYDSLFKCISTDRNIGKYGYKCHTPKDVLICVDSVGRTECSPSDIDLVQNFTAEYHIECQGIAEECWENRQYSVLNCMEPYYFNHEDFFIEYKKQYSIQNLRYLKNGLNLFCCLMHVKLECINKFNTTKNGECIRNPLLVYNTLEELHDIEKIQIRLGCRKPEVYEKFLSEKKTCAGVNSLKLSNIFIIILITSFIY